MNTSDALKILEQVTAQVSLNREGHFKVQLALDVLKKAIEKPEKEGKKK